MGLERKIRFEFRGMSLEAPYSVFVTSPEQDHALARHDFVVRDGQGLPYLIEIKCPDGIVSEHEAALTLHSFWSKKNDVFAFRNYLAHELSITRTALSSLSHHAHSARSCYGTDHWVLLISKLLNQLHAWKLKIDIGLLCHVIELVGRDEAHTAHSLLTRAFQKALVTRESRLQRRLRIATKFLACFYTLCHIPFSVRNAITSQRSWFLHHGAHPCGTLCVSSIG
jgi:hypothetical protein